MKPVLQNADARLLIQLLESESSKTTCWKNNFDPLLPAVETPQEFSGFFSANPGGFVLSADNAPPVRIKGVKRMKLYFINNPSGTVRWFFPGDAAYPSFLALYNSAGWKAKIYKTVVQLLFAIGLKSLISTGHLWIYYNRQKPFIRYWQGLPADGRIGFSIFTGTPGKNRKIILEVNQQGNTTHFAKIAVEQPQGNAKTLIDNEVNTLQQFSGKISRTVIPRVTDYGTGSSHFALISNIRPEKPLTATSLQPQHIRCLQELYAASAGKRPLAELDFFQELAQRIGQLRKSFASATVAVNRQQTALAVSPAGEVLGSTIAYLEEQIADFLKENIEDQIIATAQAHNDFTPWNMYVTPQKVHLYDWELSRPALPLLFDLFHFEFQSNILLGNKGFGAVRNGIEKALLLPETQQLINQYNINVALHYRLYLLFNVSYYSALYMVQPDLHMQSHWLMKTWNEALRADWFLPYPKPEKSHRQHFIQYFLERLSTLPYALLKYIEPSIDQLNANSDLDILIRREDLPAILQFAATFPLVRFVKQNPKSFMTYLAIYFRDGSFLQVDLIHRFVRKNVVYMDAAAVLADARRNSENLKVPSPAHDFEYVLLFYKLNGAAAEEKYTAHFAKSDPAAQRQIIDYFNEKFGQSFRSLSEIYAVKNSTFARIYTSPANRGINSIIHKINYISDIFKEMFNRKGKVITFSGVDGAGKSTILFKVKELIEKKYRQKVVIIRHRPSVLPILSAYKYGKAEAEKRTTERLPRTGGNQSTLSSLVRFGYYYTDYVMGQWYVWAKYTLRGYTVLYDRYYFDFIADARRSNINLKPGFVRALYTFVFKPDLNFFLYAPADVILQRKQEMQKPDIEKLTFSYLDLFKKLSGGRAKYIPIENIEMERTMEIIEDQFIKTIKK